MQKADYFMLLMKQRTDELVATDEKLQQFLMWVSEKSLSVSVPYKPVALRAFYFTLDRTLDLALEHALDHTFDAVRVLDVILKPSFLVGTLDLALDRALDRVLNSTLVHTLDLTFNPELRQAVQELKEQLPDPDSDEERFKQWWQANGQAWINQLRSVIIIHYRNVGHDWQFSKEQKKVIKQYYDANTLLVDCLNRAADVTPAMRSHIEETLLLPIALIEKTGSCRDK
jgi:predicted NACHT family NTPase